MRGFERAGGFLKTIGAIDGIHIYIHAPKENSIDYINGKVFHSIQLQVVELFNNLCFIYITLFSNK